MRFLFAFILISSLSFGQKDSAKFVRQSFDIIYGQKFLSHKTFGGAFNDLGKFSIGGTITFIGIGTTARYIVSRGDFDHDGHIYYTQIVPQKIKVNDTITTNLTGFNFAFTYCGFDAFPNRKNFDAIFSLGVNTGRLRLYGNSYTTQKNPYFSPKISMTPRIILGQINIQLYIDYEFDVSNKNWRKTNASNSPKISLSQTSNTGLTVLTAIGYAIKPHKHDKPIDKTE